MPKFLIHANYTDKGVQGLLREGGTSRRDAVATAAKSVGGTLESMYYAFGEADAVVIVDLPDNATAASFALRIRGSGAVTIRTTPLLTPEEIDTATAARVEYRPPGADQ